MHNWIHNNGEGEAKEWAREDERVKNGYRTIKVDGIVNSIVMVYYGKVWDRRKKYLTKIKNERRGREFIFFYFRLKLRYIWFLFHCNRSHVMLAIWMCAYFPSYFSLSLLHAVIFVMIEIVQCRGHYSTCSSTNLLCVFFFVRATCTRISFTFPFVKIFVVCFVVVFVVFVCFDASSPSRTVESRHHFYTIDLSPHSLNRLSFPGAILSFWT